MQFSSLKIIQLQPVVGNLACSSFFSVLTLVAGQSRVRGDAVVCWRGCGFGAGILISNNDRIADGRGIWVGEGNA